MSPFSNEHRVYLLGCPAICGRTPSPCYRSRSGRPSTSWPSGLRNDLGVLDDVAGPPLALITVLRHRSPHPQEVPDSLVEGVGHAGLPGNTGQDAGP